MTVMDICCLTRLHQHGINSGFSHFMAGFLVPVTGLTKSSDPGPCPEKRTEVGTMFLLDELQEVPCLLRFVTGQFPRCRSCGWCVKMLLEEIKCLRVHLHETGVIRQVRLCLEKIAHVEVKRLPCRRICMVCISASNALHICGILGHGHLDSVPSVVYRSQDGMMSTAGQGIQGKRIQRTTTFSNAVHLLGPSDDVVDSGGA